MLISLVMRLISTRKSNQAKGKALIIQMKHVVQEETNLPTAVNSAYWVTQVLTHNQPGNTNSSSFFVLVCICNFNSFPNNNKCNNIFVCDVLCIVPYVYVFILTISIYPTVSTPFLKMSWEEDGILGVLSGFQPVIPPTSPQHSS